MTKKPSLWQRVREAQAAMPQPPTETIRTPDFTLRITIVDSLTVWTTEACQWCQEQDTTCYARVTQEGGIIVEIECCTGCLLLCVEAVDYADQTVPVDVEVTRDAAGRPF